MSLKKVKRVYVTLLDPETGKSRGLTIYGLTPDEVYEKIRKLFECGS